MIKQYGVVVAGILAVSLSAQAADDFGMVLDLEGEMRIVRQSSDLPGDLGEPINVGDRLHLAKGAEATVVAYLDCRETYLTGPVEVLVEWETLKASDPKQLSEGRKLPVCYSQEELNATESGVIGGLVLRGVANDPVHALRTDYEQGKASNSTLMTLVLYDLANGQSEQARPYFSELRRRAPDSPFIRQLAGHFKTDQP